MLYEVVESFEKKQEDDVNAKTAEATGGFVSAKTVQRARAYVKAVKKNPKKYLMRKRKKPKKIKKTKKNDHILMETNTKVLH